MINATYGKPKHIKGIEQSLFLTFRYKQSIVNAIRTITPRYWDSEHKYWETSFDALSELKELLPEEEFIVYGEPISQKKYGEKVVDHSITLPKAIKTKLFPYQKETFDEGMAYDKYIYNLEQGLGKGITTLTTVLKRMELNQVNKCLVIVAVNSIKHVWEQEIIKHTEGIKCKILGNRQNKKGIWLTKGTKEKLEDLDNIEDDVQFYITNIESLRERAITDKLVKLTDKGIFNCIVLDESHRCAVPSSQQAKAFMRLENHVSYSLLLTGTILMNKPDDLYVPLKITGAYTGNYNNFKLRYNVYGGYMDKKVVGFKHLDELQSKLMSVSKRIRKADVLKDLPPKTYIDEYIEMNSKQTKIYNDVLSVIMADIDNIMLSVDPLSQMVRLRQATADTSILSTTVHESAKFERALEIIEEIIANGESVIVYSNWETVVTKFREYLAKNGLTSAVITGKIKDREEQFRIFNSDGCNVIVGTTNALGVGFTLNKASNIVFIDEPWHLAAKVQAEDRCHRIGQHSNVVVYTLMCKNTIDENINKLVKRKGAMSDTLVDAKYNLQDEKVLHFLLTGEGEI